ncbi:MAG: hypothetical protein JKY67_14710 [Pseudomonadales bacterium]|nr:hypothetical protein [Pseudomonadales bacterium]
MITRREITPCIIMALSLYPNTLLAGEKGTTIIGSNESPKVLNIVPWKTKELSADPWKNRKGPSSAVLNNALEPLDRDELQREIQYYKLLHGAESTNDIK